MGRVLDFFDHKWDGYITCFKTKKLSLDAVDNDTFVYNYDDKPKSTAKKGEIIESGRKDSVVSLREMVSGSKLPPPIFSFFLDGSRHAYKVDDISIRNKVFPIVAGQIIVGCCERKSRDQFKGCMLQNKLVLALPDDVDFDDGGENFCRSLKEELNEHISQNRIIREWNVKFDRILLYRTDAQTGNKDKDNYR